MLWAVLSRYVLHWYDWVALGVFVFCLLYILTRKRVQRGPLQQVREEAREVVAKGLDVTAKTAGTVVGVTAKTALGATKATLATATSATRKIADEMARTASEVVPGIG